MARTKFWFTDEHMRVILPAVASLDAQHPGDNRNFATELVRAVSAATGQMYGPQVYLKLLEVADCPRRPNASTFNRAKEGIIRSMASGRSPAGGGAALTPAAAPELHRLVLATVESSIGHLADKLLGQLKSAGPAVPQQATPPADAGMEAIWQERALAAEAAAEDAERRTRQVFAQLGDACLELSQATKAAQKSRDEMERTLGNLEALRKTMLLAIDEVRQKVAEEKLRNAAAEKRLSERNREQDLMIETLRRQINAMRDGAAVSLVTHPDAFGRCFDHGA